MANKKTNKETNKETDEETKEETSQRDYIKKFLEEIARKKPLRKSELLAEAGIKDWRTGEDIIWEMVVAGDLVIGSDSRIRLGRDEDKSPPKKRFTCFFQHTCPTESVDGFTAKELYGELCGKPIDNKILMQEIHADDYLIAQDICRNDARPGWGTIVLMVFEGYVDPIVQSDLIIKLRKNENV